MNASDTDDDQLRDTAAAGRARARAAQRVLELGRADLVDDAGLVISELVANAILHGRGCTGIAISAIDGGIRIEVHDGSRVPPVLARPSEDSLTGRGLRLVNSVAARWGADSEPAGKLVWAEITGEPRDAPDDVTEDELLAMWGDEAWELEAGDNRFHVELGDVPTDLLLAAKSHVDNLVREFALASQGAQSGTTAEVHPHLTALLTAVVDRFAEARVAIKHQALEAARHDLPVTRLALDLPAGAADAAEEYIAALDEVDTYCRARRLLTLETPPQHRLFRHWYIDQLVEQLRAAAAGQPPPPRQTFEHRLLQELDRLAGLQRISERAARLHAVAAALATAATPEAVASAVLTEGVAALGASGGGILLIADADRLSLPGAVGYDEEVVARLRAESRRAELPAAVALRTGVPVWLESRAERDRRFPELVGLEADTVSMCAVPLEVQGRQLGALRFSFSEARLFDEDERRFVLALAAQTAQALERAQLQAARIDVSRRLQRSLLPPRLPELPGLDIAALYHPFGDGVDVGGDFYDLWPIGDKRWALAVSDASGTGPEAAALTARVRYTLRALTMNESEPEEVVRTLNRMLLDPISEGDGERFCTLLFGIITCGDPVELRLASGGHPSPLVRRADGRIMQFPVGGALLGVFPDVPMGQARLALEPGDTVVLFTDGVIEARRDGAMFGYKGLEEVLSTPVTDAQAVAHALEEAVLQHTGGSLSDDMAAMVLHVPPTEEGSATVPGG